MSAFSASGPRRHLRLAESTNDIARELAAAGAPCGTVVTADQQSAGRGRHGRRWLAPPRSALLCSAILRPLSDRHALLPLAVPVAICEAAESLAPVECMVKWPNDVWLAERKLGGVLIEARMPEWAVIGIGLNLAVPEDAFPHDLRWPATSLGHGVVPDQALGALRGALTRWLDAEPGAVREAFGARDALRGREIAWESAGGTGDSGAGTAVGIDERGNLIVETDAGECLALGAGEVTLRIARG